MHTLRYIIIIIAQLSYFISLMQPALAPIKSRLRPVIAHKQATQVKRKKCKNITFMYTV